MTATARAWRVGVLVAFVVALLIGTAGGDDRWWPIGPMVMFAFSVDPDGEVHSLGLEADTVDGQHVVVPLGQGGIGLERAEIEGQATRIVARPARLQAVAVAAARSLPAASRYRTVYLVDTVSRLHEGEVVGAPRRSVQCRWQVVDPAHPVDLS